MTNVVSWNYWTLQTLSNVLPPDQSQGINELSLNDYNLYKIARFVKFGSPLNVSEVWDANDWQILR